MGLRCLPSARRLGLPCRDRSVVMASQSHDAGPVIVRLPTEIDGTNVDKVRDLLDAACIPSAAVVVADLTTTGFCDSCGFREMVAGSRLLAAAGIELRLALPPGPVRQAMHLL